MPEKPVKRFTRVEILQALQALGDELSQQSVRAQIFIVGGAAMALAYSTRRVTRDIDAVFEPKASVYEAAARVAEDRGLPEDWLNDAVKGFIRASIKGFQDIQVGQKLFRYEGDRQIADVELVLAHQIEQ